MKSKRECYCKRKIFKVHFSEVIKFLNREKYYSLRKLHELNI